MPGDLRACSETRFIPEADKVECGAWERLSPRGRSVSQLRKELLLRRERLLLGNRILTVLRKRFLEVMMLLLIKC